MLFVGYKPKNRDFLKKNRKKMIWSTINVNRQTFKSKLIFVLLQKIIARKQNRLSDKAISLQPFWFRSTSKPKASYFDLIVSPLLSLLQIYFFKIAYNDRGYGHLAVCGSIRCRETTRWMREQNCRNARQPANEHRRVLGGRFLFFRKANHNLVPLDIF